MENKIYKLQYLPIFREDVIQAAAYIKYNLNNDAAAQKLIKDVENAIMKRRQQPDIFESYATSKQRDYDYYRIYVVNYVIYYVLIDDVMEIRRFLYQRRDARRYL